MPIYSSSFWQHCKLQHFLAIFCHIFTVHAQKRLLMHSYQNSDTTIKFTNPDFLQNRDIFVIGSYYTV